MLKNCFLIFFQC
uniref:Uncharacterized protein n=1 Tax=Arundo donax TaxID=35708 RepID=A0A0A9CDC3_ARUDO